MEHFDSLLSALKENKLVLFIGSGFSKECNFPDWKELAEPIADELSIDIDENTDYSLIFQYYQDKYKNRNKLNSLLCNTFYSIPENLVNHKLLAELPVSEIWTTNFDKSIEIYFMKANRKVAIKKNVADLSITLSNVDCTIYKMHGDLCNPTNCILTKDDYEKYADSHEPFIATLKRTLIEKTVLFIGYSLNDPDFNSVLSSIRKYYDNNFSTHYWITRKESDAKKRTQQELFEKNLLNYGIETIEINDFSEITNLLKNLIIQNNRNNVFISGASVKYEDENENIIRYDFVKTLSNELIKRKYNIFNGYGVEIGSAVVEGAYSEIYSKNLYFDSRERIKLYPFYQKKNDKKSYEEFKKTYRNEMLRQVRIAIFVYGTKIENGTTVDSLGMKEEFNIAKEKGIFLVPVGSTGGMSEKLWDKIHSDMDSYGYKTDNLKSCFEKLKTFSPKNNKDELIENIFELIELKGKGE